MQAISYLPTAGSKGETSARVISKCLAKLCIYLTFLKSRGLA